METPPAININRICAPFDGMDRNLTAEESGRITKSVRDYFIERGVIQGDHDDTLDRVHAPFDSTKKD
jgi:hypothetical protein